LNNDKEFNSKYLSATKWSTLTQSISKLVSPITNMILARIIAPEAFGVVASVSMIISFGDILTDAGFQKYLIQHNFKNEKEKYLNANIAFWTNFFISFIIFICIVIFRNELAIVVGNPGLGDVLAIASIQLLLTSFSSIQIALYRRDFDFKTLFWVRIISIFVPFIVTIPLALFNLSYWALIIGSLTIQMVNAIILTIRSEWKPRFYYSFAILKEMFSFSFWSLLEAISIWLTSWVDVFIIGSVLTSYYLGLYKTSITMVNLIMTIITASIIPVLFSTLSRLQDNSEKFKDVYFDTQKYVSIIVIPLGVGLYLYRNLATQLLLGRQWSEASNIIGIWALTSVIMIVFCYFSSEVYRAKGKPKLSFIAQLLHLVVLVPGCIISSKYGFLTLVYSRAIIRLEAVLVHLLIMKYIIKFPIFRTFKNIFPTIIGSLIMYIFGLILQNVSSTLIWNLFSILFCICLYFVVLLLFPNMRQDIIKIYSRIRRIV
jgi:PST family polysaccharide transporter